MTTDLTLKAIQTVLSKDATPLSISDKPTSQRPSKTQGTRETIITSPTDPVITPQMDDITRSHKRGPPGLMAEMTTTQDEIMTELDRREQQYKARHPAIHTDGKIRAPPLNYDLQNPLEVDPNDPCPQPREIDTQVAQTFGADLELQAINNYLVGSSHYEDEKPDFKQTPCNYEHKYGR